MKRPAQCENCGAVLFGGESFCGECGAPAPSSIELVDEIEEPRPAAPPDARPNQPQDRATAWRVIAAVLVAVGALLCLLGLAVFLLFGSMDTESVTEAENWVFSASCCLLPLIGMGTAIAIAGLVIWWAKLRNRKGS